MDWRRTYIRSVARQFVCNQWTESDIRNYIQLDILVLSDDKEQEIINEIIDKIRMMEDQIDHRFQYGT